MNRQFYFKFENVKWWYLNFSYPSNILQIPFSNSSKHQGPKIILRQTQQWSKGQPFSGLPLYSLKFFNMKFKLVSYSTWCVEWL